MAWKRRPGSSRAAQLQSKAVPCRGAERTSLAAQTLGAKEEDMRMRSRDRPPGVYVTGLVAMIHNGILQLVSATIGRRPRVYGRWVQTLEDLANHFTAAGEMVH